MIAAMSFTACSFFEDTFNDSDSGTVTFYMSNPNGRSIFGSDKDESKEPEITAYLTISLKGGYETSQTVELKEDGVSLSFSDIPVGTELWAEATIYVKDGEEEIILYTGKSDSVKITAGKNTLSLEMTKYTGKSADDKESDNPDSADNPQELPITYIDIYVSATGDDTDGDGLSLDTAFKTINRACDEIIAVGQADENYKILVNGTITGLNGGVGETYGPSTIPEELTPDMAKSILITGATPQTDWTDEDVPEDVIDRGLAATTNNTTNGNAVVVNTEVPVTFENIKITRGCAGNGSAMQIAEGAIVKLGNGLLITKNYGGSSGYGTVLNKGTLFMYGSAVIGNKSAGSLAENSSSPSNVTNGTSANYAGHGGGICNGTSASTDNIQAKLYLGYKGYGDDGVTPIKSILSGGIYQNGGGGIYNSYHSYVYFDSGNIMWNAYSSGGGIRNYADATLIMTGGNIMNNTGTHGGGVYNEKDSSNFYMSGGTITKNSASNGGGGVYNGGQFFMSGSAVIGDIEDSTKPETLQAATASEFGNKGNEGGGIYNIFNSGSSLSGKLYLGYSGFESDNVTLKESPLTGGIYHNYSTYNESGETNKGGGGAIYSSGTIKMASGTIAHNHAVKNGGGIRNSYSANGHTFEITGGTIRDNTADENGGAIYLLNSGNHRLSLSGNASISAGDTGTNDIYLDGTGSSRPQLTLADNYSSNDEIRFSVSGYVANDTLINFSTSASENLKNSMCRKFTINAQDDSGVKKIWVVKPNATGAQTGIMQRPGVGDIVFKDGTALAYYSDLSLTNAEKAKAIAVIFHNGTGCSSDGTTRILGMGLKHSEKRKWCIDGAHFYNKQLSDIQSSTGTYGSGPSMTYEFYLNLNGKDNFSKISEFLQDTENGTTDDTGTTGNYPAFDFAKNYADITGSHVADTAYEDGWWLPSTCELYQIWLNMSFVNESLGACACEAVGSERYYWSASQYSLESSKAYVIDFENEHGAPASSSFLNENAVCAIREF